MVLSYIYILRPFMFKIKESEVNSKIDEGCAFYFLFSIFKS